jgi:type I restriction enzyme M protein
MTSNPQPPYLNHAIAAGLVKFSGEGKAERIHYVAADHSERWSDPEEKVRAEFWAELIFKYGYKPERIGIEVKVERRTPDDRADLVIYADDAQKDRYFVFECKRADISDAEFAQSIEQACGNRASLGAKFAGAIAGMTRRLLRFDDAKKYPSGERDRNVIADIPVRYGKPPAWRFYKGGFRMEKGGRVAASDLPAVPREELRSAIRKCHQTLWEGGRRSPIAAFGEFCKIVFVKHRDEKDLTRADGEPYAFQRGDETADELAARIHKLYDAEKNNEPDVFTDKINIEPAILANCVDHLEGISLDRTELDTKGVAFEEFMGGFFKGDFGQYFTPRELIAFAVEVLDPKQGDLVLDPACGSGGFLLYALDHVRREADKKKTKGSIEHFKYWHDFAEKRLFGIEINEELARVAKMNMIIHDDGHTNIVGHDALDMFVAPKPKKDEEGRLIAPPPRTYLGDRNDGMKPGKFDLVLTNPPFGSVVKRTEKAEGYLEQFDLRNYLGKSATGTEPDESAKGERDAKRGAKAVKDRASIKTEILFLERVHSFLRPGTGRAAIVLPDGILTNSSLQGVRDWLLARFQLLAVVSLPQFAFAHYDAGVKASLVFLRRLKDGEKVKDDAPIFMALAENIGYDATGRKTFAVTVEKEVPGIEKVELQRSDLFDYRVTYEWSTTNPKKPDWSERHRAIIPDTGLVAQWRAFEKDPAPFFV